MKPRLPLLLFSALLGCLVLHAQPPQGGPPSPWSVGVFVSTDSQPYKDASGIVRVLPSVVYRGERLQVRGPLVQYRLYRNDWVTLNANAALQFSPFENDDSFVLADLEEPDPTLLAGLDARLSLRDLLGPRWSLFFTAEGDVLGEHNGFQFTAGGSYSLGSPRSPLSGGVGAGVLLQDGNWVNYFAEVPIRNATESRPAYDASSAMNPYISFRFLYLINRNWSLLGIARLEWLDEAWSDSPIISDDTRTTSFVALNYTF